jgi:hypothetical protein
LLVVIVVVTVGGVVVIVVVTVGGVVVIVAVIVSADADFLANAREGETCGTYSRYPKQLPTSTDALQLCHWLLPLSARPKFQIAEKLISMSIYQVV